MLAEEESGELRKFDEGVVSKWGELMRDQEAEMNELAVPYFGEEDRERENREKMLAFLEDLLAAGGD